MGKPKMYATSHPGQLCLAVPSWVCGVSTSESGYWATCGYANLRIANSWTGHLADWSTRGLDNSRTGQVADTDYVDVNNVPNH